MRISTWNIEGRLSRFSRAGQRGSPEGIIQNIQKLDSDIIFLPEAFDQKRMLEPQISQQVKGLGYKILDVGYEEKGERKFAAVIKPHMLLLSRFTIDNFQKIRLGDSRNMMVLDVQDPSSGKIVRFFCIHLDDRTERGRLGQIKTLIPYINDSKFPVIVMGDFNAMHGYSRSAIILRSKVTSTLIKAVPHLQTKDILLRLSEMGTGDTLQQIRTFANLTDADTSNSPTTTPKMRGQEYMPSIRLFQIDHIFISPEIEVIDFSVSKDGGSDHRAVSATVRIAGQNNTPVL